MKIDAAKSLFSEDFHLIYPSFKKMWRLNHPEREEETIQKLFFAIFSMDYAQAEETLGKLRNAISPQANLESDWMMHRIEKSVRRLPDTASREEAIEIASNAMADAFEAADTRRKRKCTSCGEPNQLLKTDEDKLVWKISKCCRFAQYCSPECLQTHWFKHRFVHLKSPLKK